MQDLKDVTNNVHYENYRSKKLSSVSTTSNDGKTKTQTKYVRGCSELVPLSLCTAIVRS